MKLNDISDADKPELKRPKTQAANYATNTAHLGFLFMNTVMHDPALCGQSIFIPDLLDVNQGALPPAEDEML